MRKVLAYMVHLFTASGAVLAVFSLYFAARHNWYSAYLLLVIAVIVDSVDGLLARFIQVQAVLPEIDGSLLDNIIDFLVWSIVTVFIAWEAGLLPPVYDFFIVSLICIASAYQFCRTDAKSKSRKTPAQPDHNPDARQTKTEDYFFRGFPSAWILLVYCLLFSRTSQIFNAVILTICAVLSFVPIKCIYPTRTIMWKKTNMIVTGLWLAALLATLLDKSPLPVWFVVFSAFYAAYYVVGSLRLTWKLRNLSKRTQ